MDRSRGIARALLIAVPSVALIVVPAFIPSAEPRFLGMPAIMWWICLWVALTPFCLFLFGWLRRS